MVGHQRMVWSVKSWWLTASIAFFIQGVIEKCVSLSLPVDDVNRGLLRIDSTLMLILGAFCLFCALLVKG